MSILIKGMKKPDRCIDCPFMISRDNDDCILQSDAANALFMNWDDMKLNCPLVDLEDDTPMFATAFRGSDLTEEEESAVDHLFDMMTAVKQQVLLGKALHNEK